MFRKAFGRVFRIVPFLEDLFRIHFWPIIHVLCIYFVSPSNLSIFLSVPSELRSVGVNTLKRRLQKEVCSSPSLPKVSLSFVSPSFAFFHILFPCSSLVVPRIPYLSPTCFLCWPFPIPPRHRSDLRCCSCPMQSSLLFIVQMDLIIHHTIISGHALYFRDGEISWGIGYLFFIIILNQFFEQLFRACPFFSELEESQYVSFIFVKCNSDLFL